MSVTSAFTPRIGDAESLPRDRLSGVPARSAGADGERKEPTSRWGLTSEGGTTPYPHIDSVGDLGRCGLADGSP
jgi:hypothetical protein